MLLVGFEPEEESPIVFLRLRKAARKRGAAGVLDRAVRHPRADEDVGGTLLRDRARARRPRALDALGTATLADALRKPAR